MPKYNVHLYREMRLFFPGVEAATPEEAARIAAGKQADAAASIDDECDGENLAALIDVVGDDQYQLSVTIDFEPERLRKAAPHLLAACQMVVDRWEAGDLAEAARACAAAVAQTTRINQPERSHP